MSSAGRLIVAVLCSLVSFVGVARAQHALCVDEHGRVEVVRRAEGKVPYVQHGGKWESVDGVPLALAPVPEYAPATITVLKRSFAKGARAVSDDGPLTDAVLVNSGRFVFNGDFEASRALDDVVLVLELSDRNHPDMLFVHGLGHLDAHAVKHVSIDEITGFRLIGVGLRHIYFFADGVELFTSQMPERARQHALDAMVARRTAAEHDAPPRPLYVEDPVYPAGLKSRVKGQATVVCTVDARGEVHDPVVASASDPSFGPAALEAVRQWRFVPAVKAGRAVETRVNLPVEFTPPARW